MKKLTLLTALLFTLSANARCIDGITTTSGPFTVNADNTVTDSTTGLTWMRCSLGQTGKDCSGGSASKYTWAGALNEVANNHSGWRLPNIKELTSIVELKCYSPTINTMVFPNTQSSYYWSSSPHANDNNDAWVVDFYNGYDYGNNKVNNNYVRLVRGSSDH